MSSRAIRAGRAFVELFADATKLKAGLKSAEGDVRKFGAQVKSVGQSITLTAVALMAPFALSAKTFADYTDTMAQVRAVTNATASDFERLNTTAKELGASTSFSARQVAEGMTFLGMAGFNTEQILAGIPAVLNLARAGAIDLGMAADIASDVGSAFGLAADDIAHIADVMAVTASSANTNIAMMGETLKYAAPLAKAAGQSLEDTATAIGVLGNSGIKASMAGTDLAMIMKLMGGDAKEAMAAIGVSAVDAEGNIRSIVDVMRDLGEATKNMTQEERLSFFSKNFDRAAKSAIILSDAGSSMEDLRRKILNAEGAAERMADMMDDNLGGSFRAFLSAVEGVQIAIGDALAPALRTVTDLATSFAAWLKEFADRHQTLITVVASSVAALGALGVVLVTVGMAAQAVAFTMGGVVSAVGLATKAMAGMKAASAFLIANPIALALVGVAAAASAAAIALNNANYHTAQLSQSMSDAQEAGDKTRKSSQLLLQRLEQLASKQQLTSQEMAEAERIIRDLNKAWGDLGITFNSATGQIEGMAGAQSRLNQLMREAAVADVNASIAETSNNIAELRREMESATGFWTNFPIFGSGGVAAIEAAAGKLEVEQEKFRALQTRLAALTGGDEGAITGETAPTPEEATEANVAKHIEDLKKAREDAAKAEERWADIEEQIAAKRRTQLQQELHEIGELAKERRRLNELRIEGEKAREGGPRQEVLNQLEADQEQTYLDEELDKSEAVAREMRAAAEEAAKAEEARAEALREAEEAAADEIKRLEIEVDPDMSELEKELALLELDMQKELAEAIEAGTDPDLVRRKFELRRQLAEQGANVDAAADRATGGTTTGSFSALAAVRSFAGGSAQDRTAKATEETAKNTKKLVDNQKDAKIRFN